ncbi:MAG: hypothetical protein ACD_75C01315G0002 [uncultured bacterium]|nr:MAG: hypothetical protein ACD_75C01315G0002 [uncultured bacterium]
MPESKLKKRTSETRSVRMPAARAMILILFSSLRKRMSNTPAKGRKITVERMGNPKGFMVKYGDMGSIPSQPLCISNGRHPTTKTNHRIANSMKSARPMYVWILPV